MCVRAYSLGTFSIFSRLHDCSPSSIITSRILCRADQNQPPPLQRSSITHGAHLLQRARRILRSHYPKSCSIPGTDAIIVNELFKKGEKGEKCSAASGRWTFFPFERRHCCVCVCACKTKPDPLNARCDKAALRVLMLHRRRGRFCFGCCVDGWYFTSCALQPNTNSN